MNVSGIVSVQMMTLVLMMSHTITEAKRTEQCVANHPVQGLNPYDTCVCWM